MKELHKSERIRGPNLAVFISESDGVPMEEALRRADESNLTIASNRRLSRVLDRRTYEITSEEGISIYASFPCWTGTMAGYTAPGKKLGRAIESSDPGSGVRYVFPVPDYLRNERDVVLVAEHPDFHIEADGRNRVVITENPGWVEDFPEEKGWYKADLRHGIPFGNPIREDYAQAYLNREESSVSLVWRAYDGDLGGDNRLDVSMDLPISNCRGVVVESALPSSRAMVLRELLRRCTPEELASALRSLDIGALLSAYGFMARPKP
ncbi:MAG: hypothetical protein U0R44_04165 [Candidatus Micrarchaeia archaeon]